MNPGPSQPGLVVVVGSRDDDVTVECEVVEISVVDTAEGVKVSIVVERRG